MIGGWWQLRCMSKSYMRSKHPMKSWSQQIWAWYLFTYLVTLVEIIWIESSAIPNITTIADLQFLTSKAGIWIKFELEDILYWQQLRWLAKPLLYTSSSLHRVGNTISFQVSCYFDSADNFSMDYHTCDGDVTATMIFQHFEGHVDNTISHEKQASPQVRTTYYRSTIDLHPYVYIIFLLPFEGGAMVGVVWSSLKQPAFGFRWSSAKVSQLMSLSIASDSFSLWAQRALNSRHILLHGNSGKDNIPHCGRA